MDPEFFENKTNQNIAKKVQEYLDLKYEQETQEKLRSQDRQFLLTQLKNFIARHSKARQILMMIFNDEEEIKNFQEWIQNQKIDNENEFSSNLSNPREENKDLFRVAFSEISFEYFQNYV